jgi:hypothetical protein
VWKPVGKYGKGRWAWGRMSGWVGGVLGELEIGGKICGEIWVG